MTPVIQRRALSALVLAALPGLAAAQGRGDPLPSWREGGTKRAILDFLRATTTPGSADFVAPAERLAVFDNDGTLWVEQPLYAQFAFALDRVRALAPQHPEWAMRDPFRAVLANDMHALVQTGEHGLAEIIAVTHTGMSPEVFRQTALAWLATARHPRFARPYTECIYQPMLEVLALFRARGFRTCIVSGGTLEFMRPWAEQAYGVPPDQIVGTTFKLHYGLANGRGELTTLSEVDLLDDGPGKPAGIARAFGRRPIAAFGNSDGDYEMLEYTTTGPGRRLGLIVHHDDAAREYAYDRQSHIGRLDRALTAAPQQRWLVTSMRDDWARVFPDV
ncbi:HAD family hydrolase [Roseococcus pinisoli]|nr:HAD family hydrolase [Roseococcus pinisoli]